VSRASPPRSWGRRPSAARSSRSRARPAAYAPSFDPLSPSSNWAGDLGGFLGAGHSSSFGFNQTCDIGCAGNPQFQVVVRESNPDSGVTYTLLVEGVGVVLTGGGPTSTASLQSFRASAAPKGVLVRWRTRSEQNALGFNLYRGDTKKVRLTRSMVRASGDGRGHTYSYLDRSARKGKAAPYYLEVVQRSGSKIMFGPALRATG
jgi:hypothetical protein